MPLQKASSSQPHYSFDSEVQKLNLGLTELWKYRELTLYLTWRDLVVGYKQTLTGLLWIVLNPIWTMVIFTVVFGRFVGIDTGDTPYPIFAYAALLPWNYFSVALTGISTGLVRNQNLVTKVYFPRLVIPFVSALTPLLNLALSLLVLLVLLVWYGIMPGWNILLLPLFILYAGLISLAIGLWISVWNVKYRDITYLNTILLQVLMYGSPIIYPISMVPEKWRTLYQLNPVTQTVQGFRWAILDEPFISLPLVAVSLSVVLAVLVGGLIFFTRSQETFADNI